LNIDQSIYSKIENGTRKVKTEEIVGISNFLKLPLYHFFPNTITELVNENLKEQIKALREDNNNKNEIIKSLFATIQKLENDKT
jgi:transcriptional regulator with XRE-family HTH domain